MTTRSQDEILARMEAVLAEDVFMDFRAEALLLALDFEHARPFLNEGVTAEDWDADRPSDMETHARQYYQFAVTKIRDHRGISANRSVNKLCEYAWLLGRDDVVTAMDAAEYEQYGAPKVKAFAAGFDLTWPLDLDMVRMAAGLPCTSDCDEGCAR